jgi:hypothetical protein
MMTLLGSLLGFGTSIVPEILGFFKQGQANKQELAMLEAKAKYAQALSSMKLEELDAKAEIVETEKLYEHDMALAARGGWIVSLQASVRPVITYMFMLTFLGVEGAIIYTLMTSQGADFITALQAAWTPEIQAIWSSILSFWFGSRAMSKATAMAVKKK